MRDLVFIDSETTGLEPDHHEIIEVAAARVDPRTLIIQRELDAKTQPEHPERSDPEAIRKNGFSVERWDDALPLDEVLERSPVLNGSVLAGHNVEFDLGFLETAYRRAELVFPDIDIYLVDTASLAWPLVVAEVIERPSLRNLCEHFDISNEGAHSAPADVRRTIAVYRKLMSLFPGGRVAIGARSRRKGEAMGARARRAVPRGHARCGGEARSAVPFG